MRSEPIVAGNLIKFPLRLFECTGYAHKVGTPIIEDIWEHLPDSVIYEIVG